MSTKTWVIICLVCVSAGAALRAKLGPQPTTKVVEQIVYKDRVVTHTITSTRADGTTQSDTTTTATSTETDKRQKDVTVPGSGSPSWLISADANIGLQDVPFYGLQVQHQLLGPLSVGVRGDTRGTIGAVIGFSF